MSCSGVLRRLAEDFDIAVLIAEHRLERCLPAADRVLAMVGGELACDAPPAEFLAWALRHAPDAGDAGGAAARRRRASPPAAGVRAARRRALRDRGLAARPARRAERRGARSRGAAPAAGAALHAACGTSFAAARRSCAGSISTSRRASGSR